MKLPSWAQSLAANDIMWAMKARMFNAQCMVDPEPLRDLLIVVSRVDQIVLAICYQLKEVQNES